MAGQLEPSASRFATLVPGQQPWVPQALAVVVDVVDGAGQLDPAASRFKTLVPGQQPCAPQLTGRVVVVALSSLLFDSFTGMLSMASSMTILRVVVLMAVVVLLVVMKPWVT